MKCCRFSCEVVDDVVAFSGNARNAGKVFDVREQTPPLRLKQIDDIQIFRLRLEVATLRRQEMDMRIAGSTNRARSC